jgi:alanine dehydrogenase
MATTKDHEVEFTPKGVHVTAKNGLRVYVTESGFAKIAGNPDQPYRNPAQAIAHLAGMFDLATVQLRKRAGIENGVAEADV